MTKSAPVCWYYVKSDDSQIWSLVSFEESHPDQSFQSNIEKPYPATRTLFQAAEVDRWVLCQDLIRMVFSAKPVVAL